MTPHDVGPRVRLVTGKDDLRETIQDLEHRHERGEFGCVAFRIYGLDGSWEDVVVGARTDLERVAALENLRADMA